MFKKFNILTICLYCCVHLFAQVKIGNNFNVINNASLLELESTDKGFVLPHIQVTDVNATTPLASDALNGTLIFNTNSAIGYGRGIYCWDSIDTRWIPAVSFRSGGSTNYVAKWTNSYTVGSSTVLYDDGSRIGLNTINPQNELDVSGAMAVGDYAGTNTAPAKGLIVSGTVGIGTASPNSNTKMDVFGRYRLGSSGTNQKNLISFSATVNTSVPPQFEALTIVGITVLGLNSGSNYVDVSLTAPNTLSSTQASVVASPAFDLPPGVSIAFARMVSTSQVKIRLMNVNATAKSVSGNFNITIHEF